jgi:uncharacterized protein YkwD
MLVGLALSTGALATGSAQATPAPEATSTRAAYATLTTGQFESRLLSKTNHRREARGCRPVRLNASLALAARRHSAQMSLQSTLSHRLIGEPDLVARVESAGYTHWRILAENLAWGQTSPRAVFRDWVHSPHTGPTSTTAGCATSGSASSTSAAALG